MFDKSLLTSSHVWDSFVHSTMFYLELLQSQKDEKCHNFYSVRFWLSETLFSFDFILYQLKNKKSGIGFEEIPGG